METMVIWWSFKVLGSERRHGWSAPLFLIQNFESSSHCIAHFCKGGNPCLCRTWVEYVTQMLLTVRVMGDHFLLWLPAAWQKKQKSRGELNQGINCPQSTREDHWPGYGSLAKRRAFIFFGKVKSPLKQGRSICLLFARKAKFKWDSLSAWFVYLGVALIILISFISWKKRSWSYPLCQKYNLERVCENKLHIDKVHAATSECSGSAASVTMSIPVLPCWDSSNYLCWTSAGRSYHFTRQSTWLRAVALSDNIQCSLHLSDTGIYLLNSFQTSRFWHFAKFPSMHPHWLIYSERLRSKYTRQYFQCFLLSGQ